MNTFELHYSEALIRKAVWAFWRRTMGWRFFVAVALLLVAFAYLVASGDRSWWVGAFASVLGFAGIFAVMLYFVQYRESITKLRRMRSPQGTFEVGDERFRIASDVGSSELSWSTITEIWRFSEFWLLLFSRAQFITLPLADLDSEARELILSRAKSHGAKII